MLRTCIICGVERNTTSQRSQYVCSAKPCQRKARPRVVMNGHALPKRKKWFQVLTKERRLKLKGLYRGDR